MLRFVGQPFVRVVDALLDLRRRAVEAAREGGDLVLDRPASVSGDVQIAGGPPGALLYGFTSQAIGIQNTLLFVPVAVMMLWLSFRIFTRLWDFRREDHIHEASVSAAP